jgi:hypothetical protein
VRIALLVGAALNVIPLKHRNKPARAVVLTMTDCSPRFSGAERRRRDKLVVSRRTGIKRPARNGWMQRDQRRSVPFR